MARPGLVVTGILVAFVGLWLVTLIPHWFTAGLLLIGLGCLAYGCMPTADSPANAQGPTRGTQGVRRSLAELERLHNDGVLTLIE